MNKKLKLHKYIVHFSAEIFGHTEVEAFDLEDAEEQAQSYVCGLSVDEFNDEPIHAEVELVIKAKPKPKKTTR